MSQEPIEPAPVPREQEFGGAGRVVTLLLILTVSLLWLQHHLGFEFAKLGVMLLAGTIWATAGKFANWLGATSALGNLADRFFRKPLRALLRPATRTGPLSVIGVTAAVMMALLSSVAVRGESAADRSGISLTSVDTRGSTRRDSLSRDKPLVRFFPVLTSPFGRIYELDADGYVPTHVTVYPLVGRQLVLGQGIAPAPSVLFRPFGEGVVALKDGGVFRVSRLRDGKAEPLAADSGTASSFLVGQRKPVPDAMLVFWTLEATASGAPEAVRAELLVTWRNVRQVPVRGELSPRDCLVAEVLLGGQLKERAVVVLSTAPFVDVLMHEVTSASEVLPSC